MDEILELCAEVANAAENLIYLTCNPDFYLTTSFQMDENKHFQLQIKYKDKKRKFIASTEFKEITNVPPSREVKDQLIERAEILASLIVHRLKHEVPKL